MKLIGRARSDVGNLRENNEDRYLCDPKNGIFVVADGIGGKPGGEVASQAVVDGIEQRASRFRELTDGRKAPFNDSDREHIFGELIAGLEEVNHEIYGLRERSEYPRGVGCTTDLVMVAKGSAFILHVGDSRVYLLRNEQVFRLTSDHTFAEKLRGNPVLRERYPNPGDYDHILTRSIGGEPHVKIDRIFVDLEPGDRLVLCTDGITNYLSGIEIRDVADETDSDCLPDRLVDMANDKGGKDNSTVVVVTVGEGEDRSFSKAPTRRDTFRSVRFLQSVDLFSELEFQELLKIMRYLEVRGAESGEFIISRGDPVDGIYFVMCGELSVQINEEELTTVEVGNHFGEFALFGAPIRSADVRCLESCEILFMSKDKLRQLVQQDAALGNKLLWRLLSRTSEIIQKMLIT